MFKVIRARRIELVATTKNNYKKTITAKTTTTETIHTYCMLFSSLPYWLFSGRLHEVPQLPIILYYLYLQILSSLLLPHNYYPIITHPVNFPCGRKLENPEKTYDFPARAIRCLIPGPTFYISFVLQHCLCSTHYV